MLYRVAWGNARVLRLEYRILATHVARADACLADLGDISSDRLQSHATRRLLTVKLLAIVCLLNLLHRSHLAILLPLHFMSLRLHLSGRCSLLVLNVFLHLVLVHLTIKDALVGVLHLEFVHALLFDLLLSLSSSLLLTHTVSNFNPLFLLLLFHSKVLHMLLIHVGLLTQSGVLVGDETLLVCAPRVVLKFWHRR